MKQIIISVGREFGSGGHIVAQKLAEHYDIPIFNKELLEEMARKEDTVRRRWRNTMKSL